MSCAEASDPRAPVAALRDWLASDVPPRPHGAGCARALADAADSQGLAGILSGVLEPREWPEEVVERLRATRRRLLYRGVQQLDALAFCVDRLAGAGLRSLPLKGAALAEDLYGSVADRPMCDVDLLALDGFQAARRALESAGLRIVDVSDHAVALRGDRGVTVELHESVTSCRGLFRAPAESLWARSRECPGQVRRVPSREDLLVQLGLHAAFQHGLVLSLVQHLDLRRILEQPLVPGRVAAVARETGAEVALAASLRAATVLVGARIPPALQSVLEPALAEADERWLRRRLARPEQSIAPGAAPLLRLRWMTARGRRIALVSGTLFRHPVEAPFARAVRLAARLGVPALLRLLPAWRRPGG
jgi:hypothetical protein